LLKPKKHLVTYLHNGRKRGIGKPKKPKQNKESLYWGSEEKITLKRQHLKKMG